MTHRTRRSVVTAAATVGAAGLAGCLSDGVVLRGDASDSLESDADPDPSTRGRDHGELPGEALETFEDLDGWVSMLDGGTLDADDEDPYAGTQSARLSADEDTAYAGIYTTSTDGLDLSEQSLSLAVRFTGRDQLELTLELFAPNARNAQARRRTLTGPEDRWVRVDFGTVGGRGDPDLTAVRELRLTVRRRGADSGPIECWIDDLRIAERPDRGRVLLLFDGTLESHHATALDRLADHGFAGVEAVIPEAVGETGRLTMEQLDDLVDAGWDVAARPRTGARFLHEYTPEEQEGMIRRTRSWLDHYGFEDGADHFVTPRNVLSTAAADLVAEYHEQAFRYGGAPNALPLTDPHNLGFVPGDEGAATTAAVDHAAANRQLTVLHFEHVGEAGLDEASFEAVLEHVAAQDVDVVTATELLEDG